MTGPIGDEGFKIADGYLRVYTDYKDAIKDERKFLNQSEDDFDRHHDRQRQQARVAGRQAGKEYGDGFGDGLRRVLRGLVSGFVKLLRPLARGLLVALGAVAKLAGLGLIVGTVAVAVGGLASAIANLIPIIAELVNVLVSASGALLLIPGGIAAIITVVATAKLGLKGMGDAMKAVASGDAAQLNEALKKLAPNARAFVREIARLKPAFDRMRLRIQNTLFAGLAKSMRDLGRLTLPVVNTGLVEMGRVLNGIVRDAFTFLLNAQTRLDLARIFHLASVAVGNLRRGLLPILSILRDVATVGLEVLASLTQGFGRTLTGWAADIAKLRQEGGLEELIRDGLAAGKALLLLLGDIVGIVRSLVRAAGGAGGLFSFFDRLNRLLQSVEGQTVLKELFVDLDRIGRALIPVLLTLLKALMPVVDGIAQIAEAFSPGLTVLLAALGNALSLLVGPIKALSPLLFAIARGLAPVAVILGELVKAATPGLTVFLEALVDALIALVPVAPIVGRALGNLLIALAPLLETAGPALAVLLTVLATGLSALAKLLGPVIKLFAAGLGQALSRLLGIMIPIAQKLLPMLVEQGLRIADAFAPLIPLFAQIAEMFFARLAVHIPIVLGLLEKLIPIIGDWAEVVGEALVQALVDLMPHMPELIRAMSELTINILRILVAVAPLLPAFARFAAMILQIIERSGLLRFWLIVIIGLMAGLANTLNHVAEVLRRVVDWLRGARDGVSGFGRAVSNAIGTAIGLFGTLRSRVLNAVGNLSRLLFGAGRSAIQGLIDGVKSMFGNLGAAMSRAAGLVRDYWPFSPARRGPLSGRGDLRHAGRNVVDRLTEGVEDRLSRAAAAAAALAGLFGAGSGFGGGFGGPALATAGAAGGAGAGGRPTLGPYVIQVGDRPIVEMVIDAINGQPQIVAAASAEGDRQRTFLGGRRG